MNDNGLRKIVILGGGTAGWIAAAGLVNKLQNRFTEVILIESDDIPTIGVGEATIPPLRTFLKSLKIDEKDFIQHTQATFKLGIKFKNWHHQGDAYYHPFGKTGVVIEGNEFYRCWDKARAEGYQSNFTDFCPSVTMCERQRFARDEDVPKESFVSGATYAYHFDAGLVAKYLRRYSEARGVKRIEGKVISVQQDTQGFIQSLFLASGEKVDGDFFIDCSGFRGMLIEETLQSGYIPWDDYLLCDRAVTVQTENTEDIPPYTVANAKDSGWTWRIPLQHRTGNGYVFCSKYCSDEQALQMLSDSLRGQKQLTEPKIISFVTGVRKKIWNKNCLALGLASGFLEPLESTAIHLVMKSLDVFMTMLPDRQQNTVLSKEFNRIMHREYEDIRDFIILHYCTTERQDSPFWQHCKTMTIPDSLAEKIALFRARGIIYYNPYDLFKQVNWYAVFEGMKVYPQQQDPATELIDMQKTINILNQMKTLVGETVDKLPSHQQYLDTYCPALTK
jgi:tryptophan halogenase